MYYDQKKLFTALIDHDLLTPELLEIISQRARRSGQDPEEILVSQRFVEQDKLMAIKSALLGIPPADLVGKKVSRKVLALFPPAVASQYQIIAFAQSGKTVSVGLVNPNNFKALEIAQSVLDQQGLSARYFIISANSLASASSQYLSVKNDLFESLVRVGREARQIDNQLSSVGNPRQALETIPVSKLLLVIITHALDGRASDIHIEPIDDEVRVRYRIDGVLNTSLIFPRYMHDSLVARFKLLSRLDLRQSAKSQSGRFRLAVYGQEVDFRLTTLPIFDGEKVVVRILDSVSQSLSLSSLGFSPPQQEKINQAIGKGSGLVLLAGPSGSGKTQTLYAILNQLNSENYNIITLEDPIEHYIAGINQSEIDESIGYDYLTGLQAMLKQDPDLIVLQEINSSVVAQEAVQAGLNRHLILSRIYTRNSLDVIQRLLDFGLEPFVVASALNLIIAQRLAKKICPDCAQPADLSDGVLKKIKKHLEKVPANYQLGFNSEQLVFHQASGCTRCAYSGCRGRVIVSEILSLDDNLRQAIIDNNDQAITESLKGQGFINFFQSALLQAANGIISIDEALNIGQLS